MMTVILVAPIAKRDSRERCSELRKMSQMGWGHSGSGVKTWLASNHSLAEAPTTCGVCASTVT
jgi:hypothetical protein